MIRQPAEIERLYIDFDCFFASVEQQLQPQLRGRPLGVLPFMSRASCVIAPSQRGVKGASEPLFLRACSRSGGFDDIDDLLNAGRALLQHRPLVGT